MALSNKTYQNLATALTPEVVNFIQSDERWVMFLQDVVPDAINTNLGQLDDDVLYELSLCVMDRILLQHS